MPWLGIALSGLLHLLIGLAWRGEQSGHAPAEPRPVLHAQLRIRLFEAPAQARPAPLPTETARGEVKGRHLADGQAPAPPAARLASSARAPTSSPDTGQVSGPLSGNLLERARGQIDRESRQRMLDPMFAAPAGQAPALSPLARALGVPVVGESRIGERLYQYTTAGGRRFCVSVPPDIDLTNRDLPTPARTLVPTNCPQ